MSAVVIAFRTPGTPPPQDLPVYIPSLPDSDRPSDTEDDDELSADILHFRTPAKAAAIPKHETSRRVRRILRLAAEWDVGHLVMAVSPGGAA